MKKKRQKNKINWILNIIGIILILFFIFRFIALIKGETIIHFFWLCNHIPLIAGIAILARNRFWLTAEISFLFFGFFTWVTDYIAIMFFGVHVSGATTYLFPITDKFFFGVTSVVHFLSIPLMISALYIMKNPAKKAWLGALIHAIILVPIIIYFGREYNLDCFLHPCINWIPNFALYPPIIFLGYFLIFVIPINYALVKLIKNKK